MTKLRCHMAALAASALLVACGGVVAPSSGPAASQSPAASSAAPKPSAASSPAAKPSASASAAAAPASVKPSASAASAPPSAAASQPPVTNPLVVSDAQMASSALKPVRLGGHTINLPAGFGISQLAANLNVPRFMAFDSAGNLAAAEDGANRVTLFKQQNGQLSGTPTPLISGLSDPTSVAFFQNYLYVAEAGQVARYTYQNGAATGRQVVIPNLPAATDHHTRTIMFGPDGALYLAMGAPCNVCATSDPRYATVGRYNPDGSGYALVAKGLRNAVGLAFQPNSNVLWATVMGRDNLGDDIPWDLIATIRQGADYGWPRCYDDRQRDPQFGTSAGCGDVTLPEVGLQAHVAPLGLAFYTGSQFPAEYRGDMFVGLHGSWNRSQPVGYKLVRAHFDNGRIASVTDFATGWRQGGPGQIVSTPYGQGSAGFWGRPVQPVVGPDGALYVSDDYAGAIYRIAAS
ncbi:MAG TPA: PQQ-dependent sugar dehydrogenase [Chloroflexota bacterium]